MRYVSKASPNSGVPGRNVRPWSAETTPTSKKKIFRRSDRLPLSFFPPSRKLIKNQRVFKNLKIFIHRRALHLRIIGHVGEVHNGCIAQGGDFKETAKSRDVPGGSLGNDFLL